MQFNTRRNNGCALFLIELFVLVVVWLLAYPAIGMNPDLSSEPVRPFLATVLSWIIAKVVVSALHQANT